MTHTAEIDETWRSICSRLGNKGFRVSKRKSVRQLDGFEQRVCLLKSRHGPQYYVHISFLIDGIEDFPDRSQCGDVNVRLETMFGRRNRDVVLSALDFSLPINIEARLAGLDTSLGDLVEFLVRFDNLEAIKAGVVAYANREDDVQFSYVVPATFVFFGLDVPRYPGT